MYHLKKSILRAFEALVGALSVLSLAAAVYVLAAQELAEIVRIERFALLNNLLIIERFLTQPAVDFLHANVPTMFMGVDVAPYLIAAAIITLWATCEGEIHRLRVMRWDLEERRREELLAASARARALEAARQAEFERRHPSPPPLVS